ncbi:MAG TPA: VWA domain-containing protein [Terriglobia bacterium]|nr:VWA domain-containing protein [Terriglobia bacterium]
MLKDDRITERAPRHLAELVLAGLIGLVWFSGSASFAGRIIGQADQNAAKESKPPAAPAAPSSAGGSSTATSSNGDNNIKVTVRVVNVPVSVLDKRGVPLIDLTQNDFQVFEDGRPQTIKYFLRGTRPPLRIGLIVDTSNSARRKLSFEQDAASEFVFNMLQGHSSQNQIFLQTFDATSSLLVDFTSDPEVLNEKIRGLKAAGGKALYDAIYYACREKMLKTGPPEESRRVLVVISDGIDVESKHSLEEALSMAHTSETAIYSICNIAYGFANEGDKVLRQAAESTGGAAFFPQQEAPGTDLGTGYLSHGQIGDTSQNKGLGAATGIYEAERLEKLADSLDAIGRELSEQYNIGYTPTNNALDGTYRTIKVVVAQRIVAARKGVILRNKPGYFASPQ